MKKMAVLIGMLVVFTCGTSAWATLYNINFDDLSAALVNSAITDQYASSKIHFLPQGTNYPSLTFPTVTVPSSDPVMYVNAPTGGIDPDSGNILNLYGGTLGTPVYGLTTVTNGGSSVTAYTSKWKSEKDEETQFYTIRTGTSGNYTYSYGKNVPTTNFLGFNNNNDNIVSGTAMKFDSPIDYLSLAINRPGPKNGSTDVVVALFNGSTFVGSTVLYPSTTSGWKIFDSTLDPALSGKLFDLAVVYGDKRFMMDDIKYNTVPIPPSFLLFGSGLSGLFFFRRKKIEC